MAKTAEEKAKEKEEKRLADEKEAEELATESARVEAEKAAQEEEKRKAREAKAGTENQERSYSKAEVQAMLKQLAVDLKSNKEGEDDMDDEEAYKQKKIRIPRFQNKFITSFQNTNTDEYFPELVVHAFDVWNTETKRNDPWVTAVFEDDTTLTVPLYTVLTKSNKVWVDLVEVVQKDTSYSDGKVERADIKEYSRQGTGTFVKLKVVQSDYSYKVRFPDGKEVLVGREVVNW